MTRKNAMQVVVLSVSSSLLSVEQADESYFCGLRLQLSDANSIAAGGRLVQLTVAIVARQRTRRCQATDNAHVIFTLRVFFGVVVVLIRRLSVSRERVLYS